MRLTEINEIILGNVELPRNERNGEYPDWSSEIKSAIQACDGLYDKSHLQKTSSHTEFYAANPMMDAFISDWWNKPNDRLFKKELFYAMLCEVYVPHIPSELTALFVKTRAACETPNKMIASLDKSRMKKYLTQGFSSDSTMMKQLLDRLWGYDVSLVTKVRPLVTNNGVVEIYIENINDILLCNESIRDILTDVNDVYDLWYSKDKGIVIGEREIPLRTLIHSFGITEDDLDLRRVFLADETSGNI